MGKIVAIANQKGGVGKTTTAINLAACLAVLEQKVLVIDMDPQSNTTYGLGVSNQDFEHSVYDCLLNDFPVQEVIQETDTPNLYVLPRSEEHTSELQSRGQLVCRLLLEKKKEKDNDRQKQQTTNH